MNKKILFLIVLCASLLLLRLDSVHAASIGVSPSQIEISALRPGVSTKREITISRSDTNVQQKFSLSVGTEEGSTWITFSPSQEVVIAKGEDRATTTITITVPENAAYKRYLPKIKIVEQEQNTLTGVNIQSGLVVGLNLLVTNTTVIKLNVLSAKVKESKLGGLLKLLMVFENEGNVKVAPARMTLTIRTAANKPVIQLENTVLEAIEPLSTAEKVVDFDIVTLTVGEYLAKLAVFDTNNKEIYTYDLFFRVAPLPTSEPQKTGISTTSMRVIISVLVLFSTVSVGIWATGFLRNRKKQQSASV